MKRELQLLPECRQHFRIPSYATKFRLIEIVELQIQTGNESRALLWSTIVDLLSSTVSLNALHIFRGLVKIFQCYWKLVDKISDIKLKFNGRGGTIS